MFDPYKKPTLLFSGGKHSLVLLHVFKKDLKNLTVVWVNTGASNKIDFIKQELSKYETASVVELKGKQPKFIEQYGWPADVLPIYSIKTETHGKENRPINFVARTFCCDFNLWKPIRDYVTEEKVDLIITGQVNYEELKNPQIVRVLNEFNGFSVLAPLIDWTESDIEKYIIDNNITLPKDYEHNEHSIDCINCTAYLRQNKRWFHEKKINSELWQKTSPIFEALKHDIALDSQILGDLL